jgi:transcriptional regulator MraZ
VVGGYTECVGQSGAKWGSVHDFPNGRHPPSEAVVFLGEFQYRIDSKGRLAIPARFRSKIEGGAALSRGVEQCLYVYQLDAWEQKGRELAASNPDPKKRRMLMHRFFSTSAECELDAQGRVIIPAKFRQYAGLNGEAVVVGVHDHFEIWSPVEWEHYNEEMEQEDLTILQLPF